MFFNKLGWLDSITCSETHTQRKEGGEIAPLKTDFTVILGFDRKRKIKKQRQKHSQFIIWIVVDAIVTDECIAVVEVLKDKEIESKKKYTRDV